MHLCVGHARALQKRVGARDLAAWEAEQRQRADVEMRDLEREAAQEAQRQEQVRAYMQACSTCTCTCTCTPACDDPIRPVRRPSLSEVPPLPLLRCHVRATCGAHPPSCMHGCTCDQAEAQLRSQVEAQERELRDAQSKLRKLNADAAADQQRILNAKTRVLSSTADAVEQRQKASAKVATDFRTVRRVGT